MSHFRFISKSYYATFVPDCRQQGWLIFQPFRRLLSGGFGEFNPAIATGDIGTALLLSFSWTDG
jgi:hypothetical protein